MRYKIKYSTQAKRDIEEIFNYINKNPFKVDAAKRAVDKIRKKIELLQLFPEGMQVLPGFENVRMATALKYRIFYRVQKPDKLVVILRVVHSSRNFGTDELEI